MSVHGADRQQTAQLLAEFLSSVGGTSRLARYVAPVLNYLAMGDSYSSGEGVKPFVTGSVLGKDSARTRCDRSAKASAYDIAGVFEQWYRANTDMQFIACSGATTDQIVGIGNVTAADHTEGFQLDEAAFVQQMAYASDAPNLITLTSAGDNVQFLKVMEHCIIDGCDIGIPGYNKTASDIDYINGVTASIFANESKLESAYATIASRAGGSNTSVLVADYPQLMPPNEHDCNSLQTLLNESEQQTINTWGSYLNSTIESAAYAAGVNFVDVVPTFAGHEICRHDSWINGLDFSLGVNPPRASFHPNAEGQQGYAEAYLKYIVQAERNGSKLTLDGLPADPQGSATQGANTQLRASAALSPLMSSADTSDTIDVGALDVNPHVADPSRCPSYFSGGELVDVSGGGFAAGASVTVELEANPPTKTTQVVTADSAGDISLTVQLPDDTTGRQLPGAGAVGYVEADGPGALSTTQSDDTMFGIGSLDASCGAQSAPPAAVTIGLYGSDGPFVPASGAVFAVTGPGLPPGTGSAGSGSFAELDTDATGMTVCASAEPAGVACVDGTLGDLQPGATYTVTEVTTPAGFDTAPSQTFVAATDNSITNVFFYNTYVGGPPPAVATVHLTASNRTALPAGAVFAMTGPGLPPLQGAVPPAGSFAELDVAASAATVCAASEPNGVSCDDGLITGLTPGATYTLTEVNPPAGYAIAAPQSFTTSTDGSPTEIAFTNSTVTSFPTASATLSLASDGTSTAPLAGGQFALTGPGLPALTGSSPAADSYAELDTTSSGATACPQLEPGGVACSKGALTGLAAGSVYTFTEVQAPPGYVPAAPQSFLTSTTGAISGLTFTDTAQTTPTITWSSPAAITYGTPLSAAQLDATASVPGSFTYSPATGAVLGAGKQTLTVTFTPDDTIDYTTATASVPLEVDPATPAITWSSPAAITYGTPLSAAQLDATASVPGSFTYSPATGAVLGAGNQTLTVTFSPEDTIDYTSATASAELTVNKATPVITWPAPVDILYGKRLSTSQLNATASVPGTFAYSPAAGALLSPGEQTLSVTFVPEDTNDYTDATATTQLNVGFSQPCITTKWSGPLTVADGKAICVGAGGQIGGPATVDGGGALWIDGGTLSSSVTTQAGAVVSINNGAIKGKLNSSGAAALTVCGTTLSGAVTVAGSTGPVFFGAGNDITAPVDITGNTGGVSFVDNNVSAAVTITENSGGFDYSGNTISGTITLSDDT